MYVLDLNGLIDHLKKNDDKQTYEAILYAVLWMSLSTPIEVISKFSFGEREKQAVPAHQWVYLLALALVPLVVYVTWRILQSFYQANGGRKQFFERLIPIGFVVSARVTIVWALVLFGIGFLRQQQFQDGAMLVLIGLAIAAIITFVYVYFEIKQSLVLLGAHDKSEKDVSLIQA